jgi:hypothetical protein
MRIVRVKVQLGRTSMKRRSLFGAIVGLLVSSAAIAATYRCQYDHHVLHFSGETKVEYGKLAKLYKCPEGHGYWLVEAQ